MKETEEIKMYSLDEYYKNIVKKMKRKELEEDVISFSVQWTKLIDFVNGKKIITPSGIKYLRKVLTFTDEE